MRRSEGRRKHEELLRENKKTTGLQLHAQPALWLDDTADVPATASAAPRQRERERGRERDRGRETEGEREREGEIEGECARSGDESGREVDGG